MRHFVRQLCRVALLSCFLGVTASAALAQAYPNKPIKAIVPFAAGSATDQIGRAFAQKMSEVLGQTIVVENKAGVNGMLGAADVAKAAPDGYTIGLGTSSQLVMNVGLYKTLPFDVERPDVDETAADDESPTSLALRLAATAEKLAMCAIRNVLQRWSANAAAAQTL